MNIELALIDAANNCQRQDALAVVTLKSGVQIEGKLQKSDYSSETAHLVINGGGWATVDKAEIAAVESKYDPTDRPRI